MQNQLILLGTQGCHLCEQAEHILQTIDVAYQYLDIMDDEKLLARYEIHIPVLLVSVAGAKELYWPFDADMVSAWLTQ
jgi:glutaredoxin